MRNQPFSQVETIEADPDTSADDPRRRPWILGFMIISTFGLIGVRVAYMQSCIAERYITPWRELIVEDEQIPCRDGRIVSRDGVILAQDESRYDIAIDYRWLQSPPHPRWLRQQVARQLSAKERRDPRLRAAAEQKIISQRAELLKSLAVVTGQEESALSASMAAIQKRIEAMLASLERKRAARTAGKQSLEIEWSAGLAGVWQVVVQELTTSPDRFNDDPIILKEELQDHVLLDDVPLEIVAAIQSQPARFPGVHIRSTSRRAYPHEDLASHLIGVRKPQAAKTALKSVSKRVGESGVERSGAARLEGTPGLMRHQLDRHGERVDSRQMHAPRDGEDVVLTIDSRLQKIAEQLLDGAIDPDSVQSSEFDAIPQGATLVAMDIWTGDLLTLACSPRPSLSVLAHPSVEEWKQLQQDARHPLFQRTTHLALAPGALFKIVTAAAALEEGFATPQESVDCRGYLDHPDEYRCQIYRQHGLGHGAVNLQDALCQSCNVYFYEMARRMGPNPICDWGARFGFGRATGIDLPGEAAGVLPSPATKTGNKWYPGTTLQLAIGQGALLVTPLQVTRMLAAIANGGYLVQPRVTMLDAEESASHSSETRKIPGLSEQTLVTLRQGLESVVHDPRGTGQSARIEMMTLAGKTGSAEVKGKPAHAWFAGYAPARNPRVAFVVVLEHAGSDSAAGPIVRDFVTELLGYGYLSPFAPDARQTEYRAAE